MAGLSFFIGKGGVGKTTVSAAYAAWLGSQEHRKSTLLISTDPAHSLADVLQAPLSDEPIRVNTPGRVFARELDAAAQIRSFLGTNRADILRVVERGSLFNAEEIGPLLDATLPGMAEIAGLLAVQELLEADEFDHIVVDTAPMGHALRMFQMPEHFARFLTFLRTASARDEVLARRFAGRRLPPDPFIERWSAMVEDLRKALRSEISEIVLVTTPEPFAVRESVRAAEWLAAEGDSLEVARIVMNRVVREGKGCAICARRARMVPAARRDLQKTYRNAELCLGEDTGEPIAGAEALLAFGKHVFGAGRLRLPSLPVPTRQVEFVEAQWPVADTELCFTVGKGGVGKTTVSAGLAVRTRVEADVRVTVCSTDPAPSLDDVFAQEIGGTPMEVLGDPQLHAAELDAVGEYRRWAERMREHVDSGLSSESGGLHVDVTYDRELLAALLDVVPPGVDEVFAILRMTELVRRNERLLVDMAPTGHALDLLRTPERLLSWTRMLLKTLAANRTLPLARDAAVEVATIQHQVRELAALMRDSSRSRVAVVIVPEPLPDRETARLLATLAQLGTPAAMLFANRVLMTETGCRRCTRQRRWQMATLGGLGKEETPLYVLPEIAGGVSGRAAVVRFTRKIWQLA